MLIFLKYFYVCYFYHKIFIALVLILNLHAEQLLQLQIVSSQNSPWLSSTAFESPPPYQSPAKDLSSPVSQPRSSSNVHSETTSISTRCISSDEEMSRSPTSPLRSLREQCSTAHSPRSETDTEMRRKVSDYHYINCIFVCMMYQVNTYFLI